MRRVVETLVLTAAPKPGTFGVSARIQPDGWALVRQGKVTEKWSPNDLCRAVEFAQKCCASRDVKFVLAALDNCPCLACSVAKVVLRKAHENEGVRRS